MFPLPIGDGPQENVVSRCTTPWVGAHPTPATPSLSFATDATTNPLNASLDAASRLLREQEAGGSNPLAPTTT